VTRLCIPALCAALALSLACFGASGATGVSAGRAAGRTVSFGSVFSVSGIGAPFGPQQVRGARLAARRVNAVGGIVGARLRIRQRNDRSDAARTPGAMRGLIRRDKVLALLGPTFSNTAATGDPVADRLGTPVLAVSNTGPGIVGDCPYPCRLVFRDSLGEEAAIPADVRSLLGERSKIAKAVVAYPREDPFGKSSAEIAARAFAAAGVSAAEIEFGEPAELQALPAGTGALMITASSGEAAVAALKAARQGGYAGPILGGNALNSRIAAARAGAAGKGARSAAAWYLGNPSAENTEFVHAYRAAYGTQPDQFAAQAYTGVLLLARAAREAGLSFKHLAADRLALAAALAKVKLDTPLGHFRFTADHDVSQPIWIDAMNGRGGRELIERRSRGGG
jgi:branched-chain amino acid transport system substrate-binding protein